MKQSGIAIFPYDETSRIRGTSRGAEQFLDIIEADGVCNVTANGLDPSAYCKKIFVTAQTNKIRLAFGGEHTITFPLVEALKSFHPGLKIVVFDAHHDAYVYPLLNHYSVFYYTVSDLKIETLIVGARYELDKCYHGTKVISDEKIMSLGTNGVLNKIRAFIAGSPFYLSIDVDVLNPIEFPAVGGPVSGGISTDILNNFVSCLLADGPVSADLVEFNPLNALDSRSALELLRPTVKLLLDWVRKCD